MAKKKQTGLDPSPEILLPEQASNGKKKKKPTNGIIRAPATNASREAVASNSSWTGKLPATLLHEHCQKLKWERVDYDMRRTKDGFIATAILSKKDPKTQTLDTVRFTPKSSLILPQETPLLARHFCATYTLHRIASFKNMKMVLPGDHKDLWTKLDDAKKEFVSSNRRLAEIEYSADPFKAQKEKASPAPLDTRSTKRASKISDVHHIKTLVPPRSTYNRPVTKQSKFHSDVTIEMSREMRSVLEKCIKRYAALGSEDDGQKLSQQGRIEIVSTLTRVGFREDHVLEACNWVCSTEDALEWLLLHVPEDDLPSCFLPSEKSNEIVLQKLSLEDEYKIQRINSMGYPRSTVDEVFKSVNNNEALCLEHLISCLVYKAFPLPFKGDASRVELDLMWSDESESLKCTYGDKYSISKDGRAISIKFSLNSLSANSKTELESELTVFRTTKYPLSIPALSLVIQGLELPSFVKLSFIRDASIHAKENLLGYPMIYDLVDWSKENFANVYHHPCPLLQLSTVTMGSGTRASELTQMGESGLRDLKNSKNRRNKHYIDYDKIYEGWVLRSNSAALKVSMAQRQTLPAWQKRDDVTNALQSSQVVLVTGETGSGKSTQVCQFIVDNLLSSGPKKVKVICSQPRRISAISLAERVAQERCDKVGKEVGYIVRGDKKVSSCNTIQFVTVGVLLRMISGPSISTGGFEALDSITHLIIDEVHERSLDIDILLCLLKKLMREKTHLRVILMSATASVDTFKNYFTGVVTVNITGRTFPVQDVYLDELPSGISDDTVFHIKRNEKKRETDQIDYRLLSRIIVHAHKTLSSKNDSGSILVFLPGTSECDRCINSLENAEEFWTLTLHASLSRAEQKKVFLSAPNGKRKLIASTNIAETSITIPDVVVVVDTGRVKETRYDSQEAVVRLVEDWESRSAARQRRGRAGRVRPGFCYKLYERSFESKEMPESSRPEILRTPLEQVYLDIKAKGIDNVTGFMNETIDPPAVSNVEAARELLFSIGAVDADDKLTSLGNLLSLFPCDLKIAKLMIYARLFGCTSKGLVLAAVLSSKEPFISSRDLRDRVKEERKAYSLGLGDVIADARAFEEWLSMESLRSSSTREWCSRKLLSYQNLQDIRSNLQQYYTSLVETGLLPPGELVPAEFDRNGNSHNLLRTILAATFSSQVCLIRFPQQKYQAVSSGTIEKDPEARAIKFFSKIGDRLFLHPGSVVFDLQKFSSPYLVYGEKFATNKVFLKQVTPVFPYHLLMYGPTLQIDIWGRGVCVDGWIRMGCWSRIGVLIGRMRNLLDETLDRVLTEKETTVVDTEIIQAVIRLLEGNGA